ncbi:MAG TPA: hypothetical protein VMV49_01705 [Candidatus Deferrimicrobium sp.]|nr:hypothetical protein [Candidatus Deferrimicrobium sp.]
MGEEFPDKKSSKRDNSDDISDIIDLIDEKSLKILATPKAEQTPLSNKQILDTSNLINIKSAYDYIGGGIHFKIAVQNVSETVITDINVTLIPTTQYQISDRVQIIGVLKPGESRGIDFELIPSTCGKSKIAGSCYYIDAAGNPHTLTIPLKEIWIKCPLVQPKKTTISEIESQKRELQKGTAKIPLKIQKNSAFDIIIDQISALDLSEVMVENFKGIYSGIAKITSEEMIIESEVKNEEVVLTVWARDLKQATGFLAYLKNLMNMAFENALKIEGKVEAICQKVLNSNDIIQRLVSLFSYCVENWTIGEILTLIKEIKAKLEKRIPDSLIIGKLEGLIEKIQKSFREMEIISEKLSIELEFQILNWLSELNRMTWDNLGTYERTFPEQKYQIQQLYKIIKENTPLITTLEKKYTNSILQCLMLIEKESGVCLFEYNFTDSILNASIIGGFLTAIQDIGSEISKDATSMTKLAYKNFEIVLEEQEKVRGALFLRGSPTEDMIKNLKLFISKFEQQFKREIEHWKGNIFNTDLAKDLVTQIFR